jgi:hypothetical protein
VLTTLLKIPLQNGNAKNAKIKPHGGACLKFQDLRGWGKRITDSFKSSLGYIVRLYLKRKKCQNIRIDFLPKKIYGWLRVMWRDVQHHWSKKNANSSYNECRQRCRETGTLPSYKAKIKLSVQLSNFTVKHLPKKMKYMYMYMNVHISIIHKRQQVETTQMSIDWLTDEQQNTIWQ